MNQQELEDRQFKLQRLEQEGKHVCDEKKENQEALEREIENNSEGILFDIDDLEEEELLKQARKLIPHKEREPISKENFLMGVQDKLETWHSRKVDCEFQIRQIESVLRKYYWSEAVGLRTNFYIEKTIQGDEIIETQYGFTSRDKGQYKVLGKTKKDNNPHSSESWRRKAEERNLKIHERKGK